MYSLIKVNSVSTPLYSYHEVFNFITSQLAQSQLLHEKSFKSCMHGSDGSTNSYLISTINNQYASVTKTIKSIRKKVVQFVCFNFQQYN